jgi:hypothetical protein
MRNWATGAQCITRFSQNFNSSDHKYLIVKYEDLYSNTREELKKVFSFLGLDSKVYDFSAAESLMVVGSSELRKAKKDKIHWKPVEKTVDFNPLTRWSQWTRTRHARFEWITGDSLARLGYTPKKQHTNRFLYTSLNLFLDLKWKFWSGLQYIKYIRTRYL